MNLSRKTMKTKEGEYLEWLDMQRGFNAYLAEKHFEEEKIKALIQKVILETNRDEG